MPWIFDDYSYNTVELKKKMRRKKFIITVIWIHNLYVTVHHPEYMPSPYDLFEGNSNDIIISAEEL